MLNADSQAKIMGIGRGEAVNQGFLDIFTAMEAEAVAMDLPARTMVWPMYDDKTDPQPGEYLAELHFVIRKVDDTNSDREADQSADASS